MMCTRLPQGNIPAHLGGRQMCSQPAGKVFGTLPQLLLPAVQLGGGRCPGRLLSARAHQALQVGLHPGNLGRKDRGLLLLLHLRRLLLCRLLWLPLWLLEGSISGSQGQAGSARLGNSCYPPAGSQLLVSGRQPRRGEQAGRQPCQVCSQRLCNASRHRRQLCRFAAARLHLQKPHRHLQLCLQALDGQHGCRHCGCRCTACLWAGCYSRTRAAGCAACFTAAAGHKQRRQRVSSRQRNAQLHAEVAAQGQQAAQLARQLLMQTRRMGR